jgi:hypothetical protein
VARVLLIDGDGDPKRSDGSVVVGLQPRFDRS